MKYRIEWTNGREPEDFPSFREAVREVQRRYPLAAGLHATPEYDGRRSRVTARDTVPKGGLAVFWPTPDIGTVETCCAAIREG